MQAPMAATADNRRAALAIGWSFACGPIVWALLHLPGAAWISMLVYHAGCLTLAGLPRAEPPRAPRARLPTIAVALSSAIVVISASAIAAHLWPSLFAANPTWRRFGLTPPFDLAWLAYYVAVNPWVEERFWRGTLLAPPVVGAIGMRAALALACIAFAGHHLAVLVASFGVAIGLLACLPVVGAGCVWTLLRRRSGSLVLPIASHVGADAGLALAYVVWVR